MHRRTFLASGLSGAVALSLAHLGTSRPSLAADGPAGLDIVDCHTHFYDPTRPGGIPWPAEGSPLYRTVLPQHLRQVKQFRPVTGTVIVEASPRVEDNAWLLELAKDDPFVLGIVGRLHPGESDFAKQVKRFAANALFRGIRISVQELKTLLDRQPLTDLQLLADHDLALDVNGGPETPAVLAQLASQLPELRVVLNHMGNVRITADAPPGQWQSGIQAAAEHANVFCKISALVEGAVPQNGNVPSDLEFYRPYLDVVWNAFGEARVIYGSNWPVSDTAADYYTVQRIAMEYALEQGDRATRNFCSLNAQRAYQWVERPGRRKGV